MVEKVTDESLLFDLFYTYPLYLQIFDMNYETPYT